MSQTTFKFLYFASHLCQGECPSPWFSEGEGAGVRLFLVTGSPSCWESSESDKYIVSFKLNHPQNETPLIIRLFKELFTVGITFYLWGGKG